MYVEKVKCHNTNRGNMLMCICVRGGAEKETFKSVFSKTPPLYFKKNTNLEKPSHKSVLLGAPIDQPNTERYLV